MNPAFCSAVLSTLGYVLLSLIACLVVSYIKRKEPKTPWGKMGLKENLLLGFIFVILSPLSGARHPSTYVVGAAFIFLCFGVIGLLEEFSSRPRSPDID